MLVTENTGRLMCVTAPFFLNLQNCQSNNNTKLFFSSQKGSVFPLPFFLITYCASKVIRFNVMQLIFAQCSKLWKSHKQWAESEVCICSEILPWIHSTPYNFLTANIHSVSSFMNFSMEEITIITLMILVTVSSFPAAQTMK